MTAPDSQRSRAKSEQILAAARTLFLEQGYGRTSTDAITQAAGVSKQTLYAYFPGKAELLAAVVARELDSLAALSQTRAAPENLPALRANLLAFARTLTIYLLRPDALALFRLLVGEAVHLPEMRALMRQTLLSRIVATAESLLLEAHASGIIQVRDANLSARMFIGPLMSYVMLDGLFGARIPDPPSEVTLAQLVDLFLLTVTSGGSAS